MSRNPYEGIKFVEQQAIISDKDGNIIFDKKVTFPDYFDENSVRIVSSKYLCNKAKIQESDLRDMIDRVSNTIADWGDKDGYFETPEQYEKFKYDLKYHQVHQNFAFNSPVYFNVGTGDNPLDPVQASACFILSVEDDMDSITNLGKNESIIFKNGSGAGSNLSKIRGSNELVKQGGRASGPTSFLKVHDCQAGIIRSGGTLRRAAKLSCLDVDHPDILKMINCKDKEEEKMRILQEAGIIAEEGYEMSDEVSFQNTNISIRLTKEFIDTVKRNGDWNTINRTDGEISGTYKAKDLLMLIAEHAWRTGDPGVQYHTNINDMNPAPSQGEIVASNPCSEYMWFDDSSCNLASYNLLSFFDDEGNFDYQLFTNVITVMITAQDIIVSNASYPTDAIEKNTKKYRALGLGYTNLGALLMRQGLPYDSEDGRELAAVITAASTGIAYRVSQDLAKLVGAPKWWNKTTKKSMYDVLGAHQQALLDNVSELTWGSMKDFAIQIWDEVMAGDVIRNAQVSLLAPTGCRAITSDLILGNGSISTMGDIFKTNGIDINKIRNRDQLGKFNYVLIETDNKPQEGFYNDYSLIKVSDTDAKWVRNDKIQEGDIILTKRF